MNAKSPIQPLMSAAWTTRLLILALSLCGATLARGTLNTWTGPATGNWTDTSGWDTGVVPSGEDANVLIDGNAGQDSYVTLAPAASAWTNGVVTTDVGDTLKLTKTYAGVTTIRVGGIINSGTNRINSHASNNSQSIGVVSLATGTVFNNTNAWIEVNGLSHAGRNRITAYLSVPAGNTNQGTIKVEQYRYDRNVSQLRLSDSGTFVNDGLIHMRIYGPGAGASSSASLAFSSATAGLTSSILGSGRILLDMESQEVRTEGTAALSASASTHVITNGTLHTIEGGGTIACSLVNLGLVRAMGTNGYLSVQNSPITEPYYGKAIINQASGKLVASGPCGMYVGTTGSAPSQFLNYGLLEARTGSFISFRRLTTTSTSKNTPATTMILEGTVAGGGQFINNFRPIQIATTATLSPGDLTSTNGTGTSTAGQISFVTNLILNAATSLNFQLGRARTPGTDYDSVAVVGNLTLDGVLNLSALTGFGNGGEYTIFTCAPGGLTNNGLTFGTLPAGASTPQLIVDGAAGTVSLFFLPRRTVFMIR